MRWAHVSANSSEVNGPFPYFTARRNMFPVDKNVRRLLWLRNALYVTFAIVGLAIIGIKAMLAH